VELTTDQKGSIAEAAIVLEAAKLGIAVFRPDEGRPAAPVLHRGGNRRGRRVLPAARPLLLHPGIPR
jgi:hypothetical protein